MNVEHAKFWGAISYHIAALRVATWKRRRRDPVSLVLMIAGVERFSKDEEAITISLRELMLTVPPLQGTLESWCRDVGIPLRGPDGPYRKEDNMENLNRLRLVINLLQLREAQS